MRNNDIDIGGSQRFLSPMVDGKRVNHAPRNLEPFEHLNETKHIAPAARGLPVVELTLSQVIALK